MKVKPFFFCFSHRNNQSASVDARGYENYCDGLKVEFLSALVRVIQPDWLVRSNLVTSE